MVISPVGSYENPFKRVSTTLFQILKGSWIVAYNKSYLHAVTKTLYRFRNVSTTYLKNQRKVTKQKFILVKTSKTNKNNKMSKKNFFIKNNNNSS
jgi:hypothetical protein